MLVWVDTCHILVWVYVAHKYHMFSVGNRTFHVLAVVVGSQISM